ncbi:MAG: hypothetical protein QG552_909 [Thermodesulfobacteriota bacterium]|nr:hypothetical protein [Thermodesulfobacteriota bacterium]
MMLHIAIIVLAAILLPILLYYECREDRRGLVPAKAALSALFVVTALVQPHPMPGYYYFVLIGLLFCLGGDVSLALPQDRMFRLGLVSFLVGHIFYSVAFFMTADTGAWTWWGTLVVLIVSGWVYFWLRPRLGRMNGPVLAYIVVITVMVSGAWSIWGDARLAWDGRIMVFAGACCFYVSDIFVARDRFVKMEALNRLIGLPLYYGGQFLLAFSVGQF